MMGTKSLLGKLLVLHELILLSLERSKVYSPQVVHDGVSWFYDLKGPLMHTRDFKRRSAKTT